ncbi:TetR/AcrR family transcriptional regulator [Myxococcota bacterium]|nr:TetR/AcrR family transcriptional regulator [Myxococcota bacterium]MBU1537512.1 TetR/AcrR family transcriptional regulator [Myxococcota bacterium]
MESGNNKLGLISAAWDLFTQKGYENTTVKDILDRMKLAKGTFYHYFASKESILNDVTEYVLTKQLSAYQEKLRDEDVGAMGRLYLLFDHLKTWKLNNTIFMRTLLRTVYSEKNLKLRHHLFDKMVTILSPLLADIFEQGVREGVFRIEHPLETAQLVLHMGFTVGSMVAREILAFMDNPGDSPQAERILRLSDCYFDSMEKIIGVDSGALDRASLADLFTIIGVGQQSQAPAPVT